MGESVVDQITNLPLVETSKYPNHQSQTTNLLGGGFTPWGRFSPILTFAYMFQMGWWWKTTQPIFTIGLSRLALWFLKIQTATEVVDFLIFVLDYATLEFLLLPHGFSHLASSPFIFDTSHFESTSSLQSFLHLDFLISICNFSRFDFFPSILAYLHLDLLVFSHSSAHTELSSSFFDAVRLASSLSARSFVCFGFSVLSYGAVNLDALAMKFTRWWFFTNPSEKYESNWVRLPQNRGCKSFSIDWWWVFEWGNFPIWTPKNNSDVGVTLPKTNRFASENRVAVCTQKRRMDHLPAPLMLRKLAAGEGIDFMEGPGSR